MSNNGHRDLELDPRTTLRTAEPHSDGLSRPEMHGCKGRECDRVEAIIEIVFRE